jgi:hopene-associated glycosyltransferase HpnB
VAIWLYLLLGRGAFWLAGRQLDDAGGAAPQPGQATAPRPAPWPAVTAVVPARNEADMVPLSLASLLAQDYPGPFSVVLVDDHSDDGTAQAARDVAAAMPGTAAAGADPARLVVLPAAPLPAGWTGKLWAVSQGVAYATSGAAPPEYLLLTDADIGYRPDALTSLVLRARTQRRVMVSLMAKLRCDSAAERALVPAFIFFFQMLYPFAWVNRTSGAHAATAAAAGGCMLVRRDALAAAGGIESIRGALIDDCALGARLKQQGPIWLGLTERVRSLRPYPRVNDIRRMVARSAYAQLRYSPLLLAGTVLGMALAYLAAPLLALAGAGPARWLGVLAWALMAVSFAPTLRFYGRSLAWAPALPAIAVTYVLFTVDSAWQHARGRGGMWKGRAQALAASSPNRTGPAR